MAQNFPQRRRLRSTRVTIAAVVLILAVITVTLSLFAQLLLWLSISSAVAVVAGITATRLVYTDMLRDRRASGIERTALARSYSALFAERSRDNSVFVSAINGRLADSDRTIGELDGVIRLADKRAELAIIRANDSAERLTVATARVVDLEEQLEIRNSELLDELAPWHGAELETVVDLLGWEERGIVAAARSKQA